MDIAGKVVLITGASQGIGRATARLFAQHGARLALAARSTDMLETLAQELPGALVLPTDLRQPDAAQQMVARTVAHYGCLDVLINNAGQGLHVPIEQVDLDQYRAVFELNVVSVIAAMQAAIPIMRAQGAGVIVNISSGTTKRTLPGLAPYASTKHALNALTLTARLELAADHIQVVLVYPAMTSTDFHQHLANAESWPPPNRGDRAAPIDTPEHVAAKILEGVQTEAAEVYADGIAALRPRT